jgi:hypothetical protein
MAYVINKFNGEQLVVLDDGTLDTSTSLGLLGRNYTGYGEVQNENFVFLLENFANENPPGRPLQGQTWYNTTTNALSVYSGTDWTPVGSATVQNNEPGGYNGALWYKANTDQLFVFESSTGSWNLIGPDAVEDFAETRIKSLTILDSNSIRHPILLSVVNGVANAIITEDEFTINVNNAIPGFSVLKKGINLSENYQLSGNVNGNSFSASILETHRKINGIPFNGSEDITIKSSTTYNLVRGDYLTGSNFDGSTTQTWSVDASSSNVIGKVVARDSAGDFAAGTITADLVGDVQGNVTSTGTSRFGRIEAAEFVGATLSGNAFTATKLQTIRQINGVNFDGTENITIPVAASNITGTTLASNVIESNLTSVGVLLSLAVDESGINIGTDLTIKNETSFPTIAVNDRIKIRINSDNTGVSFYNGAQSLALGATSSIASIVPDINETVSLGITTKRFANVYSNLFIGTATQAQYADLAEKYIADGYYEPGMVVMFGGPAEVTLADNETSKVAGVISTAPAYLMNSELHDTNVAIVALQGRVPCFVKGPVKKGDMLVSAGDGHAKSAGDNPKIGTVIGKSLADFDGLQGVIEVVVGRL